MQMTNLVGVIMKTDFKKIVVITLCFVIPIVSLFGWLSASTELDNTNETLKTLFYNGATNISRLENIDDLDKFDWKEICFSANTCRSILYNFEPRLLFENGKTDESREMIAFVSNYVEELYKALLNCDFPAFTPEQKEGLERIGHQVGSALSNGEDNFFTSLYEAYGKS